VEVNGAGTFMGTRSSILNPNRNPGVSQTEVEARLSAALGVSHFIWLSGADPAEVEATGSFTDQHIDGTARFVSRDTVLYNWTDDPDDFRFPILDRARRELQAAADEVGGPLSLVPLPVPRAPVYKTSRAARGGRGKPTPAPASYCNFYVANGVVLVPVYGDQNDGTALRILQEHFPERDVLGIESVGLVEFGGMIHCVTQQQPLDKRGPEIK
jgi:agmatine deiminase